MGYYNRLWFLFFWFLGRVGSKEVFSIIVGLFSFEVYYGFNIRLYFIFY